MDHLAWHILITLLSFLFMEWMAWFSHKYIMHGFLWIWHRSHHVPHQHALERNDLFALVFSLPAIATIYIGLENYQTYWYLVSIGAGITLYGLAYFIFHDVIVHRRIKINYVSKHPYMKRIIRAHKIHHKSLGKHDAEAFGFLWAPKKYEAK